MTQIGLAAGQRYACAAGAALAFAVAAVPASAATLLVNGDFEDGASSSPPPSNFAPGDIRGIPAGWTQVSGYDVVDIVDDSYTQGSGPDDPQYGRTLLAQSGAHMLDMNGGGVLGGIYQDVVGLAAGQQITLSLYAGQWIRNGVGSLTYSLLDSSNLSVLASGNYVVTTDWTMRSLSALVPTSGNVRVQIVAAAASQGAPGLDNVSLDYTAAVPEPASWAMMVVGLGMIGGAMRGRSRAKSLAAA